MSITFFAQSKKRHLIHKKVDKAAEYTSGFNGFRQEFANLFNSDTLEKKGIHKTEIVFIVDMDGNISQIKATGNSEPLNKAAIEAVKKIKGRWSPALVRGKPVRSYYRFPVTMKIE